MKKKVKDLTSELAQMRRKDTTQKQNVDGEELRLSSLSKSPQTLQPKPDLNETDASFKRI